MSEKFCWFFESFSCKLHSWEWSGVDSNFLNVVPGTLQSHYLWCRNLAPSSDCSSWCFPLPYSPYEKSHLCVPMVHQLFVSSSSPQGKIVLSFFFIVQGFNLMLPSPSPPTQKQCPHEGDLQTWGPYVLKHVQSHDCSVCFLVFSYKMNGVYL